MNRLSVMALAAVLALGTTAAAASPLGSAGISDFQFQLIDLAPDDGIAPSIDLSAYPGSVAGVGGDVSAEDQGASVFGPAVAAASGVYGTFGLSFISADLTSGGSAQVTATAEDYPGLAADVTSSAFFGSTDFGTQFTLSPHTELLMTGAADVSASTGAAHGFVEEADGGVAFAFAGASGIFDQQSLLQLSSDSLHPTPNSSTEAILSVAFANDTDAAVQGGFYVEAWSQAAVFPVPIPEPANAALMLAALAGMVGLGRARRLADIARPA